VRKLILMDMVVSCVAGVASSKQPPGIPVFDGVGWANHHGLCPKHHGLC